MGPATPAPEHLSHHLNHFRSASDPQIWPEDPQVQTLTVPVSDILAYIHCCIHCFTCKSHNFDRLQYSILSPVNSTSHAHRPCSSPVQPRLPEHVVPYRSITRTPFAPLSHVSLYANHLAWPTRTEFASPNNTKRGPSLPIVTPPTHRFSVPCINSKPCSQPSLSELNHNLNLINPYTFPQPR